MNVYVVTVERETPPHWWRVAGVYTTRDMAEAVASVFRSTGVMADVTEVIVDDGV